MEEQANDKKIKVMKVKIHGMHCPSCEVLIERKFKQINGIKDVRVNHANGKAKIYYTDDPDINVLENAVKSEGYSVSLWKDRSILPEKQAENKPDYLGLGAIFIIILAIYLLLKRFDFLPNIGVSDKMSYGFVFLIGIVASMSTCLAATGGLLLAVAAKYNENHPELTGKQKFRAHIYFNIGRIISYTLLGGLVGAIGSLFSLSLFANGILTIIVSIVMLLLGFQLLNIFPFMRHFQIKMPKFIAHRIHDSNEKDGKATPFIFGALTFFLPCGFTQALQLYVLSKGSFITGAITMLIFSLGTLPALASLGAVSSYTKGAMQKSFMKIAGVVVVLLAIFSIGNGLSSIGIHLPSGQVINNVNSAPIEEGKQIIEMSVNGLSYAPSHFTIKAGVPVEWRIDGRKSSGCAGVIVAPKINLVQRLSRSDITIVSFTPKSIGKIDFTCGMGMAGPGAFNVVA